MKVIEEPWPGWEIGAFAIRVGQLKLRSRSRPVGRNRHDMLNANRSNALEIEFDGKSYSTRSLRRLIAVFKKSGHPLVEFAQQHPLIAARLCGYTCSVHVIFSENRDRNQKLANARRVKVCYRAPTLVEGRTLCFAGVGASDQVVQVSADLISGETTLEVA